MIVTKVLCDNCGCEIEGDPFVIMKVNLLKANRGRDNHYCFECGEVLLDGWNAAARQSQIDMGLRKPEERSTEKQSLSAEKVEIEWIADLLARNGVQWPNRSEDIRDAKWLDLMWNRIIREHLVVAIANRKKKEQP